MQYDFECDAEDGGCATQFEISCSMEQIIGLKPECPKCGKITPVHRFWSNLYFIPPTKTLGSLADKNTSKMSQDCKDAMLLSQNKYRLKAFEGHLPDGAKRKED